MSRIVLALAVLVPSLAAVATPSRAELGRLPTDVKPTFEEIRLNLDPRKSDYTGSVRIELQVTRATSTIQFHAQEMKLTKVILKGKSGDRALQVQEGETGLVTAVSAAEIKPGDYALAIDFSNEFDRRATSLYRLESGGGAYCFTQFEACDARLAFPCWDEPSFKFPYQIILTVPKADETVSNTPIERQTAKGDLKTVVFQRTKPLPSYLLAIATGPFEFVPIPGTSIPARIVTPKGSSHLAGAAVSMTPPILAALEKYFGRPYPYEKLDMIAVPEFSPGAMENPGAITYGDRFLLFDPSTMSASKRRTLAQFTAHEIAHMWFGDMVTMQWWDDLWLNESFAEWMADKIAEEVYPDLQISVTALFELQGAMYLDAQLATRTIRQPVKSYANILSAADPLTYKKGQATLAMFEQWMGPETFRKGVLDYLQAHEWGNATADDLWASLSEASGRDIRGPMSTFLDQPGIPLVRAELLNDGQVRLSQQRSLHYGVTPPTAQLWQIPITLKYSDGTAVKTHSVLLSEATATVALPGLSGRAPAWLHPNANSTGYYRWSVDPAVLQTLAEAAPKELSPLERIGFLQNLGSLLDAGAIHGDDFCRLVMAFANDPRPEVLRAVAGSLSTVEAVFVTPDLQPAFATYVRRVLGPAAKRFGFERAPKEEEAVSLLRPSVLGWLADEGRDEEALSYGERLGKSFLADRNSVDPSLVNTAVVLSAIRGDATLFEEYKRRFETTPIPTDRDTYLAGIGNFRDPALRAKALDYTLEGPLRPHELFTIPQQVGSTVGQEKEVFEWATKHYDAVVAKIPPVYQVYLPYVGAGCEQEQLEKAKAFFSMPEHTAPGMEAELARVLEAGNDCVGLRGREGESVERYMAQLTEAK
jgi:alanyl aminopeptidase